MSGPSFLRAHARRIAAVAVVVPLYFLARLPQLSPAEAGEMASRFAFQRIELGPVSDHELRMDRPVNPSVAHIAGWINTLGAGVALCDIDGNGLCDDVVLCDPRTDEVSVRPAPGRAARYAPFVLQSSALVFDRATTAPMGVLPGDWNADGLLDLLVYFWGRTPIAYLQREHPNAAGALSSASFVACDVLPASAAAGERWFTNAATSADVDGDGRVDVVIGNYFADGARVLDASATEPVEMQDSMTRARNGGLDRILRAVGGHGGADPEAEFVEDRVALGDDARGWTLAIATADLDGDLLPEIYLANDFGSDALLHNVSTGAGHIAFAPCSGTRTFGMPASKVLGRDSFKGMGVDFGDVDGDGHLDAYVSNITTEFGLQESQFLFLNTAHEESMARGIAPFVDASESLGLARSGWAFEARLADYDDDGVLEAQQALGFLCGTANRWPELHEIAMGNDQMLANPSHWHRFSASDDLSGHAPNPLFVRSRSGRFFDLAEPIGIDEHDVRRGIAVADVDGDGRLDFAVANQWQPSALYVNASPARCGALHLSLVLRVGQELGEPSRVVPGAPEPGIRARAAVGAVVHLTRDTKPGSDCRARVAIVDGGNGHSGVNAPEVHFGLGRVVAGATRAIDVGWRDAFGRPHEQSFQVGTGRSTIWLGSPEEEP